MGAIFRYKDQAGQDDPGPWLKKVNTRQRPCGPDGKGVWVSRDRTMGLGHRRLALIDLSHAGHQPMGSEDGLLWVTYNDETYNDKDLRAALQGQGVWFRSHSDTEVLLHFYRRCGKKMVAHLRGMYAFVGAVHTALAYRTFRRPCRMKRYRPRKAFIEQALRKRSLMAWPPINVDDELS